LDSDKPVSRQFEETYYDYYAWPYYWDGPYMWGEYPYPYAMRNSEELPKSTLVGKKWDHHLRSTRAVTSYDIQAKDGEIGHVEDFIIDDTTWAIRYLIVDTGAGGQGKWFWFHRDGLNALVGPSPRSSSIFPARPSSSHLNTSMGLL